MGIVSKISSNQMNLKRALKAVSRLQGLEKLRQIALDDSVHKAVRAEALKRIFDESMLLSICDADVLLLLVEADARCFATSALFARLSALDGDWTQQLSDAAIWALAAVISGNSFEGERFDHAHIAAALKKIYMQGRAQNTIAALRGRPVSHNDFSGKGYRDKWCHQDEGFILFKPDEFVPPTPADPEEVYPCPAELPKDEALEPFIWGNGRSVEEMAKDVLNVHKPKLLIKIILEHRVPSDVRAMALKCLPDEDALLFLELEPEAAESRLNRVTDQSRLYEIIKHAQLPRIRGQALRRYEDAAGLRALVEDNPRQHYSKPLFARLDELNPGWAQSLSDDAIVKLADMISSNDRDEGFDYGPAALVLKQAYKQGRAMRAIADLRGKPVSHTDYTGKEHRDKWCHQDGGYTYFELDK